MYFYCIQINNNYTVNVIQSIEIISSNDDLLDNTIDILKLLINLPKLKNDKSDDYTFSLLLYNHSKWNSLYV